MLWGQWFWTKDQQDSAGSNLTLYLLQVNEGVPHDRPEVGFRFLLQDEDHALE